MDIAKQPIKSVDIVSFQYLYKECQTYRNGSFYSCIQDTVVANGCIGKKIVWPNACDHI